MASIKMQIDQFVEGRLSATHRQFLEIARPISLRLHQAMEDAGPVRLSRQRELPLDALLCRAVAGQQLSTAAAKTIWARVISLAGDRPLIPFLRKVSSERLCKCGLSRSKAKAMKAIVTASTSGRLDESELRSMSTEDRSLRLTEIWGVGQWTSDMINIFYFGDKNVWPEGDVTVWKTLQRLTDRRRNLTKTANQFAPKRTYLALYMYKIADAKP